MNATRYLSPEPLLQSPTWVASQLQQGYHVLAYGYARSNPVANIDSTGFDTQVIVSYGNWGGFEFFGSHSAVRVDNGGAGQPVLFDPAGGFRERSRGSGGFFEGDEAALGPYFRYHARQGDGILMFNFDTTPEDEAAIARRFGYGTDRGPVDPRGLECAATVSQNLSGIGPFRLLKPTQAPGNLARQLCRIMGLCPGGAPQPGNPQGAGRR